LVREIRRLIRATPPCFKSGLKAPKGSQQYRGRTLAGKVANSIAIMDSRKLKYFVEAVELKSLNGAASSLRVSQPALSKAIRALELQLGVKLLDRTNEGVTPTPYGTALYAHAKAVVMELNHAQAEIEGLRRSEDRLITIGTLASFSGAVLGTAVAYLHAQGRNVPPIRVVEKPEIELIPDLRRGLFDFVLGPLPAPGDGDGLSEIRLFTDQRQLIARSNHPLAGRAVTLEDLAKYPMILPTAGTLHRPMLEQMFRDKKLDPPRSTVDGPSVDLIIKVLVDSNIIVTLSPYAVQSQLNSGLLCALRFQLPLLRRIIGITYRQHPGIPTAGRPLVRQIEAICRTLEQSMPLGLDTQPD
jgi:LysR family transcriptional regulator of gallate degradation